MQGLCPSFGGADSTFRPSKDQYYCAVLRLRRTGLLQKSINKTRCCFFPLALRRCLVLVGVGRKRNEAHNIMYGGTLIILVTHSKRSHGNGRSMAGMFGGAPRVARHWPTLAGVGPPSNDTLLGHARRRCWLTCYVNRLNGSGKRGLF